MTFKSYLRNRKQLVQIDNVRTSFEVIKTGVPQGSQLGPLMFLLFINDLPIYLHHSSIDMYADDYTLYTSDISVSNLETILQKDLNRVLEWCYINKINLNAQKTKCMLVGSSHKLSKSRDLHLTIGDYKIDCVKQYKILDVNLDNNLKWSFHVDNIHKKLTNVELNLI